ncbi:MAG: hypothetical protein ACPGVP_04490 [Thiolinea sp.]
MAIDKFITVTGGVVTDTTGLEDPGVTNVILFLKPDSAFGEAFREAVSIGRHFAAIFTPGETPIQCDASVLWQVKTFDRCDGWLCYFGLTFNGSEAIARVFTANFFALQGLGKTNIVAFNKVYGTFMTLSTTKVVCCGFAAFFAQCFTPVQSNTVYFRKIISDLFRGGSGMTLAGNQCKA